MTNMLGQKYSRQIDSWWHGFVASLWGIFLTVIVKQLIYVCIYRVVFVHLISFHIRCMLVSIVKSQELVGNVGSFDFELR